MKYDFDLIVIGGGAAGIVSSVMAGGLKLKTLLIEKDRIGGECLYTGCVPSKALLHAAHTAHTMRTAGRMGLPAVEVSIEETRHVMDWVRQSVLDVREANDTMTMLKKFGVEVKYGSARFTTPHTLLLNGSSVSAQYFILATGSRPALPSLPGLNEVEYLTNRTLFELKEIPASLIVLGGGPTGVEMAQAMMRLGSRVTLVQRNSRLLPREDAELTAELTEILRSEGMQILCNATPVQVENQNGECLLTLQQNGAAHTLQAEKLLICTGRLPNTEGLNLKAAVVKTEPHRVPADSFLRTSAPHIYACGDITGSRQYSHMAEYEAKTAVSSILLKIPVRANFRTVPRALFTEPEMASVGLTEEEARQQGKKYRVYQQPFTQDDRAITDCEAVGRVKVLAHPVTGKILGVHILGPRAGELLQEWIYAMQKGRPVQEIASLIHIYPSLTMASQHAAQRWYETVSEQPLAAKGLKLWVRRVRPVQEAAALGALGIALVGLGAYLKNRTRS